jgi:hypothetical protein
VLKINVIVFLLSVLNIGCATTNVTAAAAVMQQRDVAPYTDRAAVTKKSGGNQTAKAPATMK